MARPTAIPAERLRLDETNAPDEDFWECPGNTVHMDRYRNPNTPAKVVLHHGVGTNGRQMSLILGAPLAQRGFETVALDNLGCGLTRVAPDTTPSYDAGSTSSWTSWRSNSPATTGRSCSMASARAAC